MSAWPNGIETYLHEILERTASPAYVQADATGRVIAAGGALDRFGLEAIVGASSVADRLPFLHGLLPVEGSPVQLSAVDLGHGVIADIHVWSIPGEAEVHHAILLLDAGAAAEESRIAHQRANDLALMRGRVSRLERQMQGQLDAVSDAAVLGEIHRILDTVVLEVKDDGRVDVIGDSPAWFKATVSHEPDPTLGFWRRFPFLEHFQDDARAFWTSGATGFLSSGIWSERTDDGREIHLEAQATSALSRRFLILRESTDFEERRSLIQRAREGALGSRRALKDERRQSSDLREVRDDLERRVAARTSELSAAVIRLEAEIAERQATTERLVANQRRLRALTLDLVHAEEQERRRIAVGLHDHLGQILALTKIRLSALRASAEARDLAGPLGQILTLVDDVIRATRSLTFELGAPIRSEQGLRGALTNLVEQFREQHGIETTVDDPGMPWSLAEEVETLLFQSVRELLHNVAKHADATRVSITLSITSRGTGDVVQVVVADDGVGFDSGRMVSVSPSGGFGLFSIRGRIEDLGGELTITSTPGHGARIVISAPTEPAAGPAGDLVP